MEGKLIQDSCRLNFDKRAEESIYPQFNFCAKSLHLCPTLCDPVNSSPPGSSVHEILQASILEGIAGPTTGDLPNPGLEPA